MPIDMPKLAEYKTPDEQAALVPALEIILKERDKRYGAFKGHANITWGIKHAMHGGKNWEVLPVEMKEALDMIAHKIGRILNGDYRYKDSWTDIMGYAKLVEEKLES